MPFNKTFINLTEAYLFFSIIFSQNSSVQEVNNTKEIENVVFTITDTSNPIPATRNISLAYALGELVWYWSGSNSKAFISKFGDLWNKISDDGITSNSSYGYILTEKHGFNQIEEIIKMLENNQLERRAVLNINIPNPSVISTKDEPCTIALQILIRDNKVNMTGMMRSNDIWFGTPYDIIYFTSIQKYIAHRLGLDTGTYTHFATSFHLYLKDLDKLNKSLTTIPKQKYLIDYISLIENAKKYYKIIDKMENPKKEIIEFLKKERIILYV